MKPGARALGVLLVIVTFGVWFRSHSPSRAGFVAFVAVVLLVGFRRLLEALVGGVIVLLIYLNTELIFGPPTVWLAHRIGVWPAAAIATAVMTAFNLAVIAFTRWFEWSEALHETVGRGLALVPDRGGRGSRLAARARARFAAVNRRLLRAPRLVGLAAAAIVVGAPTAAAAFAASRTEAVLAAVAYSAALALAFVGISLLV
jgi:hypothetical protein